MTADAGGVGHLLAAKRLGLGVNATPNRCLFLAGNHACQTRGPGDSRCEKKTARRRYFPHDEPTIWSDWTLTRISAPRRTMYPVTLTLWPLCGSGL